MARRATTPEKQTKGNAEERRQKRRFLFRTARESSKPVRAALNSTIHRPQRDHALRTALRIVALVDNFLTAEFTAGFEQETVNNCRPLCFGTALAFHISCQKEMRKVRTPN
jgi:hypothetical protein